MAITLQRWHWEGRKELLEVRIQSKTERHEQGGVGCCMFNTMEQRTQEKHCQSNMQFKPLQFEASQFSCRFGQCGNAGKENEVDISQANKGTKRQSMVQWSHANSHGSVFSVSVCVGVCVCIFKRERILTKSTPIVLDDAGRGQRKEHC